MKHLAAYLAWGGAAFAVLYAVLNPAAGIIYSNPTVMLALGLIGLGLCKDARKRLAAQAVAAKVRE